MPKISIIIPVYNVGAYIVKCLESVRLQTFTDFEVILVDDGSTDTSGEICDYYAGKDKRFQVIHKKNGGVSSARNVGIDVAKCELIAFIDPDDYISADFYALLYENTIKYRSDFAGCRVSLVGESGEDFIKNEVSCLGQYKRLVEDGVRRIIEGDDAKQVIFYDGNTAVLDAALVNRFSCVAWNKLFSRALWGSERFPEKLSLGEDMAITLDIITNANRAVYVPEAIYYWRQRKKSLLHGSVSFDRLLEDLSGSQMMREKLLKKHPERKDDAESLKKFYDLCCITNFVKTAKQNKGTGSVLYKMLEGSFY